MVILGGMGNTAGVIVAAVLLTAVQEPLRALGPLRMVVFALIIIALMMLRPQGLFSFSKKKGAKV